MTYVLLFKNLNTLYILLGVFNLNHMRLNTMVNLTYAFRHESNLVSPFCHLMEAIDFLREDWVINWSQVTLKCLHISERYRVNM